MKAITTYAVLILIGSAFTSVKAQPKNQVGGHVGLDFDSSELYFGPHAVLNLPFELGGKQLQLNPEFSYWLEDDDFAGASNSFWMISANLVYPVNVDFADAYVAAGLVLAHWSLSYDSSNLIFSKGSNVATEISESDNDLGVTGKVGAMFGSGSWIPVVEVGLVISSSNWLFAQAGVRHPL